MSYSIELRNRISEHYRGKDDVILTPEEEHILERWECAFTFLRESKSNAETVQMMKRKFPGVSQRTFYRDIESALSLFGNVVEATAQAKRALMNEWLSEFRRKCITAGDRTNEIRALNLYMKVNNLDKEEGEEHDPQKMFTPVSIEIDDATRSLVLLLQGRGVINLMEINKNNPVLIESNEVQPATVIAGDGLTA